MPRRRVLTQAQIKSLLALPSEPPALVRHYTFSEQDLAAIRRRRRLHNQLGFAVQLCALRYPGRVLAPGELIPPAMLRYTAAGYGFV
jgi:TnpA family transposase